MTDLIAEWAALSRSRRRRITSAIAERLITDKLEAHPHYESGGPAPRVDVFAAVREGECVRVDFVVDYFLYCQTISGSDWAEHHIYAGQAAYAAGRPLTLDVVDRSVNLSELESEHYDRDRIVQDIRAKRTAELLGVALPLPSGELERVKAIVDANARQANARASASAPSVRTVVRCPRCGATDAGATDFFFEVKQMTCRVCGHQALADDDEIGAEWNARITLSADVEALPPFVAPLAREQSDAPVAELPPVAELQPVVTADAPTPSSRAPELWPVTGGELSSDLRCPRCASSNVGEDSGRATRHFTFLSCRRCGHGEEIESLTAASRWKREG